MREFLKIIIRRIRASRLYTSIIIACLSTGITCMLFAVMFWNDEHRFDDFHSHNPNLYRITTLLRENRGENIKTVAGTGQVQGPAFKQAVPEVQSFVRVLGGDINSDIVANNKSIRVNAMFADSNFFEVFTFPLMNGSPGHVLGNINQVVLTQTTAYKLFGNEDPVGKLIQLDADPSFQKLGKPLIISGVVKDPPANSSLQFDALFPFSFLQLSFEDDNWLNAYLGTFVVLDPRAIPNQVVKKFREVYKVHAKQQVAGNVETYGFDPEISYGLQPITDTHLAPFARAGSNAEGGVANGSSPIYSWLLLGIAAFILLMASINFINISIANSLKRAKEVGIRKVVGGSRWQIVFQFAFESALLCTAAFLISLAVVYALLPLFNQLAQKQIAFGHILSLRLISYFLAVLGTIIVLTSLYPALVISRYNPSVVLYNKQQSSGKSVLARALVVIQFALAIFLLLSSMIYYRQMNFIQTSNLGYSPAGIVRTNINGNRDYKSVKDLLRNNLEKNPAIKSLSFGSDGNMYEAEINGQTVQAVHRIIDEAFLSTLEIPLQLGRNISAQFPTDKTESVLVNEAFVKAAGLKSPIGTRITTNKYFDEKTKTIVGVIKDFHQGSLREPIPPMVLFENEWASGGIWINIDRNRQHEALAAIEKTYRSVMPGSVFTYDFLDDLNARQYAREKRWQQIVSVATLISFLVCCLGLFGLAHLSTHRRVREIGIRKVLGASVNRLISMLTLDFLKLVVIAFLIATPLAWLAMNQWLKDFAYRITPGPDIFVIAGSIAVFISVVTVIFQSIHAALANPVRSLRAE